MQKHSVWDRVEIDGSYYVLCGKGPGRRFHAAGGPLSLGRGADVWGNGR